MKQSRDHNSALFGLCHFLRQPTWSGSATQTAAFLAELLDAKRVAVFLTDASGGRLWLAGAFAPGDAMWYPPATEVAVADGLFPSCPMTVAALGDRPVVVGRELGGYDLSRVLEVMPPPQGNDRIAALALRESLQGLIGLALVLGGDIRERIQDGATKLSVQAIADVIGERRRAHLLRQRLVAYERDALRRTNLPKYAPTHQIPALAGSSDQIRAVRAHLPKVSGDTLPVMLIGDTGVGREDIAREIHKLSSRRGARFVQVDLATMGPSMAVPLLCGYRAGAVQGNNGDNGLFNDASGGTLCLRGLEALSDTEQFTLLRILERKRFAPIGSGSERRLSARVITIASPNLPASCSKSLILALSGHCVKVPSLKGRREDIPAILATLLSKLGRDDLQISADALSEIGALPLSENLIELQLILKRALRAMKTAELVLYPRHFDWIEDTEKLCKVDKSEELRPTIARFEKALIQHALLNAGGDRAKAARQLHLPKRTLADKCHRYAL